MISPARLGKSILVIEDDPLIRGAMRMVLQWEDYRVTCVTNGQEALDFLRASAPPDIILLDMRMPVLDGWEFLEQQKQDPLLADIPVIVVTGSEELVYGSAAQIQKPFHPHQLLEAIRQQMTGQ